jgi:plasmid maintenance system antidote protein VapI
MPEEEWRQIRDFDYEISTLGNVRRKSKPGTLLKPQHYVSVQLVHEGQKRKFQVHRLVAEAFLGEAPSSSQVNHKDGDHANNRLENLEWLSRRANQLHAIEAGLYGGRGEKHGRAKLTDAQVRQIRQKYVPRYGEQTKLAREHGVSQVLISKIVNGEVWTHLDDCPKERPSLMAGQIHGAQLTAGQVREIRDRYTGRYGEQTALADEYGVSVHAIRKVVRGETWKSLKGTRIYNVARGFHHGRAKLTDSKVRYMRQLHFEKGWSVNDLAKRYGLARHIARDVIFGKTWKHVV